MLENGGEPVQGPPKGINGEASLDQAESRGVPLCHEGKVQAEEDNVLHNFEEVSRPGHDEPVLVQQRSFPRVVEQYRFLLVAIRYDVDEAGRRVDDPTLVYGVDSPDPSELTTPTSNFGETWGGGEREKRGTYIF